MVDWLYHAFSEGEKLLVEFKEIVEGISLIAVTVLTCIAIFGRKSINDRKQIENLKKVLDTDEKRIRDRDNEIEGLKRHLSATESHVAEIANAEFVAEMKDGNDERAYLA